MADDARISTALPKHFKTLKLKRRLGAPGCWSLVCLFLWVAENKPSGDLTGMTDEEIEIIGQWEGELGAFVRELVAVGFLDGDADARTVHDWREHNPWAASRPQRIETARAAASVRWGNKRCGGVEPDAQRMPVRCETHETAMPTSPLLSSSLLTTEDQNTSSELRSSSDQGGVAKNSRATPQPKATPTPSCEAEKLAGLLSDELRRNKPDYRITLGTQRKWAVTADRMLRRDHRKFEEVADLIRWVQRDEFWMTNVLSMDKLRELFDRLSLKAKPTSRTHTAQAQRLPSDYVSASEQIKRERRQNAAVAQ